MTEQRKTATQRIEDLENALMSLYQASDSMAKDLLTIRDAVKLLNNKLAAVVKSIESNAGLSDEVISKFMVENNIEELKSKILDLVARGALVKSEAVSPSSFLVGRQLDADGNVTNPRLQFAYVALNPELKDKALGLAVGAKLAVDSEAKETFEITELYDIQVPTAPGEEAKAPEAAPAESAPSA